LSTMLRPDHGSKKEKTVGVPGTGGKKKKKKRRGSASPNSLNISFWDGREAQGKKKKGTMWGRGKERKKERKKERRSLEMYLSISIRKDNGKLKKKRGEGLAKLIWETTSSFRDLYQAWDIQ